MTKKSINPPTNFISIKVQMRTMKQKELKSKDRKDLPTVKQLGDTGITSS